MLIPSVLEIGSVSEDVTLICDLIKDILVLDKVLSRTGLKFDEENLKNNDFYNGSFKKVIFCQRKQITAKDYLGIIENQQVQKVERWCQSLTDRIPSGIFSIFTVPIFGMAVRHEFVIVYTQNLIISMEIQKLEVAVIKINIYIRKWNKDQEIQEEILKNRWYTRCLGQSFPRNQILYLEQVNEFLNILIILWRGFGNKNYDFIQKNCISFARSLLYFSNGKIDQQNLFESMLGLFSDMIPLLRLKVYPKLLQFKESFQQMIYLLMKIRQRHCDSAK